MMAVSKPELAARLREAYGSGGLAPVSAGLDSLEAAYDVQTINTDVWVRAGRRRTGFKIGMTSLAVQRQFGVNSPDSGILFADARIEDGTAIASNQILEPRIEGEIALVLGADINAPVAADQIAAAVAGIAPAIEIADSRIGGWKITILDTIADNASAGLYVVGPMHRYSSTTDLADARMTLGCGSRIVSEGTGKATMGGPLHALAWLAGDLIRRGDHLRAGDIVLTGALGHPLAPVPGATYRVDISGVGSASVAFV